MLLETAFRELRDRWFFYHLRQHPSYNMRYVDSEWERLEKVNMKNKQLFDEKTEAAIRGELICLNPFNPEDI